MHYISVGRRFLAIVIDGLVSIAWGYPLAETIREPGYVHVDLSGARLFVYLLILLAYFVVMEGAFGATLGKLATGIRVVREDGGKIAPGAAVVRNLGRIIDYLPWVIPYLVGAIMVWNSPRRQRLGDRWANTVVVEASSVGEGTGAGGPGVGGPDAGPWMPPAPAPPEDVAPPPMPPPPPIPGAAGPRSDQTPPADPEP